MVRDDSGCSVARLPWGSSEAGSVHGRKGRTVREREREIARGETSRGDIPRGASAKRNTRANTRQDRGGVGKSGPKIRGRGETVRGKGERDSMEPSSFSRDLSLSLFLSLATEIIGAGKVLTREQKTVTNAKMGTGRAVTYASASVFPRYERQSLMILT